MSAVAGRVAADVERADGRLALAIREGDLAEVRTLVEVDGVDVHAGNDVVYRVAAACGHLHIVRWLIDKAGVDVLKSGDAIELASRAGHPETVFFLQRRRQR